VIRSARARRVELVQYCLPGCLVIVVLNVCCSACDRRGVCRGSSEWPGAEGRRQKARGGGVSRSYGLELAVERVIEVEARQ